MGNLAHCFYLWLQAEPRRFDECLGAAIVVVWSLLAYVAIRKAHAEYQRNMRRWK